MGKLAPWVINRSIKTNLKKFLVYLHMIKYISILPITIYLIYLIYIVAKYGIQISISESAYRLKKNKKWIFFLVLVSTALLMIIGYVIEQPEINTPSIILFFAGLGICYTASAYNFKKSSIVNTWHLTGAIGGYILGYVFIIVCHGWDSLFFIIPSLIIIGITKIIEDSSVRIYQAYIDEDINLDKGKYESKFTWWAEIIGLITIYLAIW